MTTLDELKARRAELDELIKREEEAAKVNKAAMFVPEYGDAYVSILTTAHGYTATTQGYICAPSSPRFRTVKHAEAIAFARSIEDQMRAQPGCVVAEHGVEQWVVRFDEYTCESIACPDDDLDLKVDYGQWGVFDSEENLQAAIRTVGAENLTRAAQAKVGIY